MKPPFVLDETQLQTTASGLQYQIVEQGTGAVPQRGQQVEAHYHGTLMDGKLFDSSYNRGKTFSFKVGAGQVIAGWDEAFAMFAIGTKAIIILPSPLAYGDRGIPGAIPARATLRFDIEVIGAK